MRAVMITRPGPPEVLEIQDVADPVPKAGEVLLDIAATAVNRADLMQRQGHYDPPPGASPYPGLECAGRIAQLGEGVSGWQIGDQVCALLSGGGYAQRVTVPIGQLLPVPRGLSLVQAAALPETACTVWSMVFATGRLQPGETLLVHGGGSGIGTMAVQLAHASGAHVIATVGSAAKAEVVAELGADLVVNYREDDFVAAVRDHTKGAGADVILDVIGAAYLPRNLEALATEGRLIVIGMQGGRRGELDLGVLVAKRASVAAASLRARPAAEKAAIVSATNAHVWPRLDDGSVRPVIDRVLPWTQVQQAHRVVEASEHVGKVVLEIA